jgi:hypothetical protein
MERQRGFTLLVLILILSAAAWSQTTTGQITGVVTDSSQSTVAAAKVTSISQETGAIQTTTSNEVGIYRLPALPVGVYRLTVEKEGFGLVTVEKIVLNTASTARVNIELKIASVSERVEVTATSPLLNAETVTGSAVVNNTAVENLPLRVSGGFRDPVALAGLTPGVTGTQGAGGFVTMISGGRGFQQEILLDGTPNMGFSNSLSAAAVTPALDTIAEFKVLTSIPPAEYGRTDSGLVTMTTKSGTRDIHGAVSDQIRNDAFDARPVFAQRRDRVRQQEFGAHVGGPVYIPKLYPQRDRTFFFFDYNGFRQSVRNGGIFRTVPTDRMRGGDFSEWPRTIYDPLTNSVGADGLMTRTPFPGNRIPEQRLSGLALKMQELYPRANAPGVVNNYLGTQISTTSTNAYFIKVNHDIVKNNRLTVSYRAKTNLNQNQGVLGRVLDGGGYDPPERTGNWILSDDHFLTPNLLNHFEFGYVRSRLIGQPSTGRDIGFQIPGAFGPGRPSMNFSHDYPGSGGTIYRMEGHNNFDWQDNMSWTRGRHAFKFGVRVGRYGLNERPRVFNDPTLPCWDCAGTYNFSNLGTGLPNAANPSLAGNAWASFLIGFVDRGQASSYPGRGWRHHYYALFFQDDYKATSRLTINYGLRWELNKPFYEVGGRVTTFNLSKPNPAAVGLPGATDYYGTGSGRIGTNNFLDSYSKGFGPRLGLAYQLRHNTVLRLGAGILHAPQRFIDTIRFPLKNGFDDFAFGVTQDVSLTPAFWLDQGFSSSQITRCCTFDPTLHNNRDAVFFHRGGSGSGRTQVTYQYTAALQQLLPGDISVDAAYVATIGKHLSTPNLVHPNQLPVSFLSLGPLLNEDINSSRAVAAGYRPPYAGFTGTVAQSLRAYPQVRDLYDPAAAAGNSSYHALQLKIEKNYSAGLQFTMSYSMSKNISDVDMYTGYDGRYSPAARDQYNRKLEKAITVYDTPQRLVAGVVYELPVGPAKWLNIGGLAGKLLGGWGISAIVTYQSGSPIYVFAPNTLGIFNGLQTANRIDSQPAMLNANRQTFDPWADRYLNPAGFAVPAPYTLGTMGRVLPDVRAFGTRNEDFSAVKRFLFTERIQAELEFSVFNAFNRHGWGFPNVDLTSPAFGTIRSAQGPRTGQAGFKVSW